VVTHVLRIHPRIVLVPNITSQDMTVFFLQEVLNVSEHIHVFFYSTVVIKLGPSSDVSDVDRYLSTLNCTCSRLMTYRLEKAHILIKRIVLLIVLTNIVGRRSYR
jgi:hypothetical protein